MSAAANKSWLIFCASANWIGFAVQLVITFFMAPVLVHGFGDERYGVWSLIESILAYLTLFDLGVAASVVRYVAKFKTTGERESLNRVFSTSLAIFTAAGGLVFVSCGLIYLFAWHRLRIPTELSGEALGALVLMAINLGFGLPLGVFPAVLSGLQQYPVMTGIRTGLLVVRALAILAAVRAGWGLVGLAAITTVSSLIEGLAMVALARRFLPDLRFSPAFVDLATFRIIRGYSLDAFVVMISSRISYQTDAIVIGAFLSPQHISFFVLASRLVTLSLGMIDIMISVLTPAVSGLESLGQHESIRKILLTGTRYLVWLILPVQIGFLILGRAFFTLWLGPKYARVTYPILVILAMPLVLTASQRVTNRVFYGIGRLRWLSRAAGLEALANLLMSLALVGPMGIAGVAWGTAVPNVAFTLALAWYGCRTFDVSFARYFRWTFLVPLAIAPVPVAVWLLGAKVAAPTTWPVFFALGATGLVCYALPAFLIEFGPRSLLNVLMLAAKRLAWRPPSGAVFE